MKQAILELKDYAVSFFTPEGEVETVRGVDLSVARGEILCLVGESGCGKSVLCKSLLKLLPSRPPHNGTIKQGRVLLEGVDITHYTEKQMRGLRGRDVSMIFQDPMLTLNPTIPVGKQIVETILKHSDMSRAAARERAIEMLGLVGIPDPEQRLKLQPHFFSGGMRQRCVIAIALAMRPKLLLADEPTTALDVTVETQILDLLRELRDKTGVSIVFVSHDLGAVARIADRVAVMYAGKIVEIGTAEDIYYHPQHPYTWGLLSALPVFADPEEALYTIPGIPPSLLNPPPGDAFAERNAYALAIDYEKMPPMMRVSDTHYAATWLLDPHAPKVKPPVRLAERSRSWRQKK